MIHSPASIHETDLLLDLRIHNSSGSEDKVDTKGLIVVTCVVSLITICGFVVVIV